MKTTTSYNPLITSDDVPRIKKSQFELNDRREYRSNEIYKKYMVTSRGDKILNKTINRNHSVTGLSMGMQDTTDYFRDKIYHNYKHNKLLEYSNYDIDQKKTLQDVPNKDETYLKKNQSSPYFYNNHMQYKINTLTDDPLVNQNKSIDLFPENKLKPIKNMESKYEKYFSETNGTQHILNQKKAIFYKVLLNNQNKLDVLTERDQNKKRKPKIHSIYTKKDHLQSYFERKKSKYIEDVKIDDKTNRSTFNEEDLLEIMSKQMETSNNNFDNKKNLPINQDLDLCKTSRKLPIEMTDKVIRFQPNNSEKNFFRLTFNKSSSDLSVQSKQKKLMTKINFKDEEKNKTHPDVPPNYYVTDIINNVELSESINPNNSKINLKKSITPDNNKNMVTKVFSRVWSKPYQDSAFMSDDSKKNELKQKFENLSKLTSGYDKSKDFLRAKKNLDNEYKTSPGNFTAVISIQKKIHKDVKLEAENQLIKKQNKKLRVKEIRTDIKIKAPSVREPSLFGPFENDKESTDSEISFDMNNTVKSIPTSEKDKITKKVAKKGKMTKKSAKKPSAHMNNKRKFPQENLGVINDSSANKHYNSCLSPTIDRPLTKDRPNSSGRQKNSNVGTTVNKTLSNEGEQSQEAGSIITNQKASSKEQSPDAKKDLLDEKLYVSLHSGEENLKYQAMNLSPLHSRRILIENQNVTHQNSTQQHDFSHEAQNSNHLNLDNTSTQEVPQININSTNDSQTKDIMIRMQQSQETLRSYNFEQTYTTNYYDTKNPELSYTLYNEIQSRQDHFDTAITDQITHQDKIDKQKNYVQKLKTISDIYKPEETNKDYNLPLNSTALTSAMQLGFQTTHKDMGFLNAQETQQINAQSESYLIKAASNLAKTVNFDPNTIKEENASIVKNDLAKTMGEHIIKTIAPKPKLKKKKKEPEDPMQVAFFKQMQKNNEIKKAALQKEANQKKKENGGISSQDQLRELSRMNAAQLAATNPHDNMTSAEKAKQLKAQYTFKINPKHVSNTDLDSIDPEHKSSVIIKENTPKKTTSPSKINSARTSKSGRKDTKRSNSILKKNSDNKSNSKNSTPTKEDKSKRDSKTKNELSVISSKSEIKTVFSSSTETVEEYIRPDPQEVYIEYMKNYKEEKRRMESEAITTLMYKNVFANEESESPGSRNNKHFMSKQFDIIVNELMEAILKLGARLIKESSVDGRIIMIRTFLTRDFFSQKIIDSLGYSQENYLVDVIVRSTQETHRQALREIYVIIKMYEFNIELDKNIIIIDEVDKNLNNFVETINVENLFKDNVSLRSGNTLKRRVSQQFAQNQKKIQDSQKKFGKEVESMKKMLPSKSASVAPSEQQVVVAVKEMPIYGRRIIKKVANNLMNLDKKYDEQINSFFEKKVLYDDRSQNSSEKKKKKKKKSRNTVITNLNLTGSICVNKGSQKMVSNSFIHTKKKLSISEDKMQIKTERNDSKNAEELKNSDIKEKKAKKNKKKPAKEEEKQLNETDNEKIGDSTEKKEEDTQTQKTNGNPSNFQEKDIRQAKNGSQILEDSQENLVKSDSVDQNQSIKFSNEAYISNETITSRNSNNDIKLSEEKEQDNNGLPKFKKSRSVDESHSLVDLNIIQNPSSRNVLYKKYNSLKRLSKKIEDQKIIAEDIIIDTYNAVETSLASSSQIAIIMANFVARSTMNLSNENNLFKKKTNSMTFVKMKTETSNDENRYNSNNKCNKYRRYSSIRQAGHDINQNKFELPMLNKVPSIVTNRSSNLRKSAQIFDKKNSVKKEDIENPYNFPSIKQNSVEQESNQGVIFLADQDLLDEIKTVMTNSEQDITKTFSSQNDNVISEKEILENKYVGKEKDDIIINEVTNDKPSEKKNLEKGKQFEDLITKVNVNESGKKIKAQSKRSQKKADKEIISSKKSSSELQSISSYCASDTSAAKWRYENWKFSVTPPTFDEWLKIRIFNRKNKLMPKIVVDETINKK